MNLYTCTRCTLSEDQDIVKDPDRKIGLVMHLVWPYDQAYAKDRIYLCLDCMQEVKEEVLKMREYYENMANKALEEDRLEEARRDMLDQHDCHASPEDGCICINEYDDGYGKDCEIGRAHV